MNKESLDKATIAFVKALKELEIENSDKLELMINVSRFLDDKKYEENIKTLRVEEKRH